MAKPIAICKCFQQAWSWEVFLSHQGSIENHPDCHAWVYTSDVKVVQDLPPKRKLGKFFK